MHTYGFSIAREEATTTLCDSTVYTKSTSLCNPVESVWNLWSLGSPNTMWLHIRFGCCCWCVESTSNSESSITQACRVSGGRC